MIRSLLFSLTLVAGLLGASSSSWACACCGSWKVVNVAKWDVLNIRSGPGVRFQKVGEIPAGSACVSRTKECRGRWCRVSYADYTGWVNVRYLRWLP